MQIKYSRSVKNVFMEWHNIISVLTSFMVEVVVSLNCTNWTTQWLKHLNSETKVNMLPTNVFVKVANCSEQLCSWWTAISQSTDSVFMKVPLGLIWSRAVMTTTIE